MAGADLDPPPARSLASDTAGKAQLRFEGPREVRAGKPFDVALRLTSPQPVRAMGAAELKVSSLVVKDAAGRAMRHEPPQAFRAAIVE